MHEETRIVRGSLSEAVAGEPLHDGPVFAAPFHTPGTFAEGTYSYARSGNPTWTHLERSIAAMESGESGPEAKALIFPSGMAAVMTVFGTLLRPGDVLVAPSDAYFLARVLSQDYFAKIGVTVRQLPTAEMRPDSAAMRETLNGAKLLLLETPSNPGMDLCDISELCEAAHAVGTLVAVDNTTATPLGQKPLVLGADISVASDTKAMTGHSDLLLGHVAVHDTALYGSMLQWRTMTGSIVGPMEAWLAQRSLVTLPLRLERMCANAQRIAEFLTTRDEISQVHYPGLKTHAGHAIAVRQMRCFGPVLSFVLRDQAAAESFLAGAALLTIATSFGGATTTAERRARWGSDAVAEGFIRMSVGVENAEDLIADIKQALERIR